MAANLETANAEMERLLAELDKMERAQIGAPNTRPAAEIRLPESGDWSALEKCLCPEAAEAERISGRSLLDPEDGFPDPSMVFDPYEQEDREAAELREVGGFRTMLCGELTITVRPRGNASGRNRGELWAGQVGLATWCGLPEGKRLLTGRRVVELGATLGLAGAAAYHERMGDCAECHLTTWKRAEYANLSRPDANNGCRVYRLNWHDLEGPGDPPAVAIAVLEKMGRVDVALAADVVAHDNGARFARVLKCLATRNPGMVAVVVNKAPHAWFDADFLPEAARLGLAHDVVDCGDLQDALTNNLEMRDVDFTEYRRYTFTLPPPAAKAGGE